MNQDFKLYRLLKAVQVGDEKAIEQFFEQFHKLFDKYAKKLSDEDAYDELCLRMYEMICKWDLEKMQKEDKFFLSYLRKTCHNDYITISKQERKERRIPFADLSEQQTYRILSELQESDEYQHLILQDMAKVLTPFEYEGLVALYFRDVSTAQLSAIVGKSRQYVNQTKRRALQKLKVFLQKTQEM